MKIKSNLIEVHIIRLRKKKVRYLLLKRSSAEKYPNIWQMVTGKVKTRETAYNAALREIKEETNLEAQKLFIVPNVNSFYNSDDNSTNLIPVLVAVVNTEKVKLSSEHQKFKWVGKRKAKSMLAWPGQSLSVNIIDDYFNNNLKNLNFIEISK